MTTVPLVHAPHAAVLQAGRHQFAPGQRNGTPCIRSRFLFRCLSGKGVVTVNGREYAVHGGDFLFLPWGRSTWYAADRSDPMAITGTHIVPCYRPGARGFVYGIPHTSSDPEASSPSRRDAHLGALEGVVRGRFTAHSPLNHLADYIVDWYLRGEREPWQSRQLAQLLLRELQTAVAMRAEEGGAMPPALQLLADTVQSDLGAPHTVATLARRAHCSAATLNRLFHHCCGTSPARWVHSLRMRHAAHLLAATTLSVAAVGREVGIEDPCHFSKRFRAWHGATPRAYRSRLRLV